MTRSVKRKEKKYWQGKMTECSWWNPVDAPPKNPGQYRVMNNENRTFDSWWNGKSWDPKFKITGSLFLNTDERITHWAHTKLEDYDSL